MNSYFVIEDHNKIRQAKEFCERMDVYREQKRQIEQRFRELGANGYLNNACVEVVTFKDESVMKPGMFLEVPREIIGDRVSYDTKAFIPNPNHPDGLALHREMESINRPMTKINGVRPFVCDNDAIRFSNVLEKDGVYYLVAPKEACEATTGLREVTAPGDSKPDATQDLSAVMNKDAKPRLKM